MSQNASQKSLNSLAGVLVLLGIVIFGNVIAGRMSMRIDITEEKLYTLTDGTVNILEGLEDNITFKFYYSRSLEGIPPQFKNYARRVEQLLEEYPSHNSRITLEVIDPEPDSEDEEVAQRYGVRGHPLQHGVNFYFGLVIVGLSNEEVIPYFDQRRERFLEYDITRGVFLASNEGKVKLGILSSLKVLGDVPPPRGFGAPPPPVNLAKAWLFTEELKKIYEIEEVPEATERIGDDIDLLIVMQPKKMSEKTRYAIDQYLMSGRNLICLMDPMYMKDQSQSNRFQPPQKDDSMDKLFKTWGIEFKADKVVADPRFATQVRSREGVVRHPAWLSLTQDALSRDQVVTAQLSQMLMIYPGTVDKVESVEGVEFTPLITSSDRSKAMEKFRMSYGTPSSLMNELRTGGSKHHVAGLFKGKFKSAYTGKPSEVTVQDKHNSEMMDTGAILVIGDVDFLEDNYCLQPIQIFGQVMGYQPLNQNTVFLNNIVEMMSGNKDLIGLRSRGKFVRPFEKVQEIEADARSKYQEKEQNLQKKLSELEQQINSKLQKVDTSNKAIVTSAVQGELDKFQEERRNIRKELRKVRKKLRGDIENLGTWLKVINILLMPALIGVLGIIIGMQRARRLRS